jgi:hypothetical protein
MSRHIVYKGDGNLLTYGFDAPTGGYFWQLINSEKEEIDGAQGLLLSQLAGTLGASFIQVEDLIRDFRRAEEPTPLQINVGKMFGRDVGKMLELVELDLMENFHMFLPE